MSKKSKKIDIVIDDVPHKQIQWSNKKDTNWKNIPQDSPGIIRSGLHRVEKDKENSHLDIYDGNKKVGKKPIEGEIPKFRAVMIDLKNHGIFPAPSENHIAVLRGSDKLGGWISLEHYQKNKRKYKVEMGDENNPDVVVEINESTINYI